MVQRYNGAMAQRYNGTTAQRDYAAKQNMKAITQSYTEDTQSSTEILNPFIFLSLWPSVILRISSV